MKDKKNSNKTVHTLKWIVNVLLVQLILINVSAAFHAYRFTHYYDDDKIRNQQSSEGKPFLRTWRMMTGKKLAKSLIQYNPIIPYDTIHLVTASGKKLEAWYMKADSAKGTVILFHGLNSNKGNVLGEAFEFNSFGYNTMLVDMRAHGNSEGIVNTLGYKESEEVELAFDHISKKGEKNIILWGMSLGAVIITKAVWQYDIKPQKIILEMPFDRLQDHIRARARISGFPGEPFGFFVTFWTGFEQGYWAYGHQTSRYVKKISCPVLLQWGNNDEYVLKKETDKIFAAISSSKKKLEIYPGAGHIPLLAANPSKWDEIVKEFLNDN
ncbi:MAG TPA: alpha/beta fold hydrolase [Chitinophagaceae bacterium]|jgi:alpha-beta hydrolase superfamily lysophospholipase|nr:alpha/beta fold hydrolase [Chitinophagaceae bacterium]